MVINYTGNGEWEGDVCSEILVLTLPWYAASHPKGLVFILITVRSTILISP